MKEKIFNLIIIIVSLFVLLELLIKKNMIYLSIIYALRLWVNNLVPSLFPFFIISDILINYNIIDYIPKNIKCLCKRIFNIDDYLLLIFVLSMVSGFPSNARNTRNLYDNKLIDSDGANHILVFTHFANPIFIITTIGVFFLHSERMGIIIIVSHYLSNIILGILWRNYFHHKNYYFENKKDKIDFGNVFIKAIKKGIDTTLMICGIVTVFLMLSTIVVEVFNFNCYLAMIIKGIFEITIGIEALGRLNLSLCYKGVIASSMLAFGGISVHVQVISQIIDTDIKYIYFFIGRIYQMIISGGITYFLCLVLRI